MSKKILNNIACPKLFWIPALCKWPGPYEWSRKKRSCSFSAWEARQLVGEAVRWTQAEVTRWEDLGKTLTLETGIQAGSFTTSVTRAQALQLPGGVLFLIYMGVGMGMTTSPTVIITLIIQRNLQYQTRSCTCKCFVVLWKGAFE